jgi:hypothetical protein
MKADHSEARVVSQLIFIHRQGSRESANPSTC